MISSLFLLNKECKWVRNANIAGFLFCSLVIITAIILTYNRPIGQDTGIILREMESISEGYVPYKTMHLNYPPLFFYMMVGVKRLLNLTYGCYGVYLTINNIMILLISWFVFLLSRSCKVNQQVSFFAAWLFALLILWYQGCIVLFEVPCMFWGLLSAALIATKGRNHKVLPLCGIFASFSVLTKQFGAAFILLNALLLYMYSSNKKKSFAYYGVGVVIPIVISLWIFGYDLITSTLLNGYGTTTNALAGEDISINAKITDIFSCLWILVVQCPMSVCLMMFPFSFKAECRMPFLICLSGVALFSLQFYFVHLAAPHYFQFFVPFIVLSFSLISQLGKKEKIVSLFIIAIPCIFTILKGVVINISPLWNYDEFSKQRQEQILIAQEIRSYTDNDKTLWIANTDLQMFYYLTGCKTPNMKEVGFSSGQWEITIDKAKKQISDADYILCRYDLDVTQADYYFSSSLRKKVYSHKYKELEGNLRLYKMK